MFLGTHEPRLDEKGRLILPAKFREELSTGLVITKGQERCLYVFPASEFATITQTLRQAPVTAIGHTDMKYVGNISRPNIKSLVHKKIILYYKDTLDDPNFNH